jgi:hypothetical protein
MTRFMIVPAWVPPPRRWCQSFCWYYVAKIVLAVSWAVATRGSTPGLWDSLYDAARKYGKSPYGQHLMDVVQNRLLLRGRWGYEGLMSFVKLVAYQFDKRHPVRGCRIFTSSLLSFAISS